MIEKKTTREIKDFSEKLIERSGYFSQKLLDWDKVWVSMESLKAWLDVVDTDLTKQMLLDELSEVGEK